MLNWWGTGGKHQKRQVKILVFFMALFMDHFLLNQMTQLLFMVEIWLYYGSLWIKYVHKMTKKEY